jgi:ribonuclease R
MANGALEIGGNEVKFKLDEKGRPVEVYEKVMGPANWLIEEFMLLANKRVAAWVGRRSRDGAPPFVYRIHDLPDPEKVEQLRALAKSFGHSCTVTAARRTLPHAINRCSRSRARRRRTSSNSHDPQHGQGHVQYGEHRALRLGLRALHALHLPHPPLPGPDGAPGHGALPGRRQGPGQEEAGTELQAQLAHGEAGERCGAGQHQVQAGRVPVGPQRRIGQSFEGIISGLHPGLGHVRGAA